MTIVEKEYFSDYEVAWPSGLRRWFKAPVSSEAWVRIPPLPNLFTRHIHIGFIKLFAKPIRMSLHHLVT